MSVGLDHIKAQTQLVGEQLRGIGNHTEDAYAAGQRGGLSKDFVGTATDVVSSAGCQGTHAYDDGFLLAQQLHLTPDLLTCIGRTTRTVDTQDHCLHVVILAELLQIFGHLL